MNKNFSFPTVQYITYETEKLPIIGKVKFRPFIVGEHRRLLEAVEVGGPGAVLDTMASIIKACTFDKVDVDSMEMFILDKLYLEIYVKSKGAEVPSNYTCGNVVDGVTCGNKVTVNIPLDKAYIEKSDGYETAKIIKLNDDAGIKLRQPTLEDFKKIRTGSEDIGSEFVFSSIECIFDGEKVSLPGVDFTMEGLATYIDTLPESIMGQINAFFENSPNLRIDLPITCPKCKHKEEIVLKGLEDFFL